MRTSLLITLLLVCTHLYGQNAPLDPEKKKLPALKIETDLKVDGVLDELEWNQAAIATDFIQQSPDPGKGPSRKTEIRILYNNTGLYVGARMYESPDSVFKEMSERDQLLNTDWIGIFMSPYRDGINGFGFILTPTGIQFDAKYSSQGEDPNWDAVWESAAQIDDEGWVAEFMIPYSAIRFPDQPIQTWQINFGRTIRRLNERVWWSELDPEVQGFLNQAGYLTGIEDIKPPIRLQATPFIAVYAEQRHNKNGDPRNSSAYSINGGMDLKYGISDAFTLDLTLIPDFGEARSDNQVLNLSPFEVRFDENRPFFTEGVELFNKGGLFYSRRVGGRPLYFNDAYNNLEEGEEVVSNPQQAQLFNATKISGRTPKGLGIGWFNATSGRMYARIENGEGEGREVMTDPLTNYNVLVLDQNLKHNSYVSLINTTVLREGKSYDANVTGTEFSIRDKKNAFQLRGTGALSQKYFLDSTDLGHRLFLGLNKTSGRLRAGVSYRELSDTYDHNDLGFLSYNNERSGGAWFNYNFFEPFGRFNRVQFGGNTNANFLYNPSVFTEFNAQLWGWAQFKNFFQINPWIYTQPVEGYDYFDPRVDGKYYRTPKSIATGIWLSTDSRKKLRISGNVRFQTYNQAGRNNWTISLRPRYRVSDRFTFSVGTRMTHRKKDEGFADLIDLVADNGEVHTGSVYGRRNQDIVENTVEALYTLTNTMTINFRLRHYWTKVNYEDYYLLKDDGRLGPVDYEQNNDTNFDAFNIDLVYRWRFAPGSDIIFVWKNAILNSSDQAENTYFQNLQNVFDAPMVNSFSVKVLYFLDYATLFPKSGNRGSRKG